MRALSILTLVILLRPTTVAGQGTTADGVHAFLRGDYEAAAAILTRLAAGATQPDPVAQFFLATLYDSGRGVARNQMRACGLYLSAGAAGNPMMFQSLEIAEAIREPLLSGTARDRFCAPASTQPWSDAPPASFSLGPNHWIRLDASSTTVGFAGAEHRTLTQRGGPEIVFLPIQYTPLDVSNPASLRRHFIQSFIWHRREPSDLSGWSLGWLLEEVVGADIFMVAGDPRLISIDGTGPPPPIDASRTVSLRVNANGEAEWTITDPAGPRGAIIPARRDR